MRQAECSIWAQWSARAAAHDAAALLAVFVGFVGLSAWVPRRRVPLLTAVGARIREGISELEGDPRVRDLRHLGGMVAFDLVGGESGYLSDRGPMLRGVAREHGALLRPLGNVVYALPPACASEEDCATIAAAMLAMVDAWSA